MIALTPDQGLHWQTSAVDTSSGRPEQTEIHSPTFVSRLTLLAVAAAAAAEKGRLVVFAVAEFVVAAAPAVVGVFGFVSVAALELVAFDFVGRAWH